MLNYYFLLLFKPLPKKGAFLIYVIYTSYSPFKKYGILFLLIYLKKKILNELRLLGFFWEKMY